MFAVPPPELMTDRRSAAINQLLSELDELDPELTRHSLATAVWSVVLARYLRLGKQSRVEAQAIGLLHAVGRLATGRPDRSAPVGAAIAVLSRYPVLTPYAHAVELMDRPGTQRLTVQIAAAAAALDCASCVDPRGQNLLPCRHGFAAVLDNRAVARVLMRLQAAPTLSSMQSAGNADPIWVAPIA